MNKTIYTTGFMEPEGMMKVTWIKKYLLNPVYFGLMGFALFFTVIILVEIFVYAAGDVKLLKIGIDSVTISLIGFGVAFIVKVITNFVKS